jgi:hypothetical protein
MAQQLGQRVTKKASYSTTYVFQRAEAEEQLRDMALVEERASGTTPAAVALEADEELEESTDDEEAAAGKI